MQPDPPSDPGPPGQFNLQRAASSSSLPPIDPISTTHHDRPPFGPATGVDFMSTRPELHWSQVIHSEIVSVTTAMRKNSRWSIGDQYLGSSNHLDRASSGSGNTVDAHSSSRERSRGRARGAAATSASRAGQQPVRAGTDADYDYCLDVAERAAVAAEMNGLADSAVGGSATGQPAGGSVRAMMPSPAIDAVLEFTSIRAASRVGSKPMLFGADGVYALVENPLLQGFTRLKAKLTLIHEFKDLDPIQLLTPFLEVIRSGDTTGPITGAALTSVEKFIKYKILDPDHPGMPVAMSALTHSVTHCKFEATDVVSDEVVLGKILRLIRVTITSEVGQRNLDDRGICEMVETGFGMCLQGRFSGW
ncbi:GDP/GTP exchange factor for ARF [Irineochytrium annulatum]|nr:GDP/GTP exchange factor for ARF [Irineochytrium annulatum]